MQRLPQGEGIENGPVLHWPPVTAALPTICKFPTIQGDAYLIAGRWNECGKIVSHDLPEEIVVQPQGGGQQMLRSETEPLEIQADQ